MRLFLAGLNGADLDVEFVTESRGSGEFRLPFWAYLAQVANHGTQHRSEAAEALTLVGRSPGGSRSHLLLAGAWRLERIQLRLSTNNHSADADRKRPYPTPR